jgi:hypothetical protein
MPYICTCGNVQALFAAVGKFGCAGAFTIASIFTSGKAFSTLCSHVMQHLWYTTEAHHSSQPVASRIQACMWFGPHILVCP